MIKMTEKHSKANKEEWERPTLEDQELPYMIKKNPDGAYSVRLDRELTQEEVLRDIGASYSTIDRLIQEIAQERKRASTILKGCAAIMSILALEAALVFFGKVLPERRYVHSIESRLTTIEQNYSQAYDLLNSNRVEEAKQIMRTNFYEKKATPTNTE